MNRVNDGRRLPAKRCFHRLPVIVAPTLCHILGHRIWHVSLGKQQFGAGRGFDQSQRQRGIMSSRPVATAPGLDDFLPGHKLNILAGGPAVKGVKFPADFRTDGRFLAGELGVLGADHPSIVDLLGCGLEHAALFDSHGLLHVLTIPGGLRRVTWCMVYCPCSIHPEEGPCRPGFVIV